MVEFYDRFFVEMGERYWLTTRALYADWQEEILAGYALWSDEKSRGLYQALLQLRLKGDYACIPEPDLTNQYYPQDLPSWEDPLLLVDCGAYDGDTLRSFLSAGFSIESAVLFEPEMENYCKLVNYISTNKLVNIFIWPCGVYSSTQHLKFDNGEGESSKLTNTGKKFIQVVALDDVIPNYKPNLIKMDIEGAEFEGLLGAKKIIEQNRPGLAICVYHRHQHLWQIPLLIHSWNLRYSFYLRSHGNNGFEVVMYAIPNTKDDM